MVGANPRRATVESARSPGPRGLKKTVRTTCSRPSAPHGVAFDNRNRHSAPLACSTSCRARRVHGRHPPRAVGRGCASELGGVRKGTVKAEFISPSVTVHIISHGTVWVTYSQSYNITRHTYGSYIVSIQITRRRFRAGGGLSWVCCPPLRVDTGGMNAAALAQLDCAQG